MIDLDLVGISEADLQQRLAKINLDPTDARRRGKRQNRVPGVFARGMTSTEYHKWHRNTFPEANKQRHAEHYRKNRDRILEQRRKRGFKVPYEKALEYRRRHEAKPKYRVARRLYRAKNRERMMAYQREYLAKKRATPRGNLDARMSSAISSSLHGRKNWRRWEDLVGYTLDDLQRHLEANFTSGMNWARFAGGQIHVDHVIPKAKFHYDKPEDIGFRQCWALVNLRPLWKSKNIRKSAKILAPSQIALGI